MSASRRSFILALAFVGAALGLSPTRVTAQPFGHQPVEQGVGQHKLWKSQLNTDQFRDLLAKGNNGGVKADPFDDMFREALKAQNPNARPDQLEAAARQLMGDKEFRERFMELAQRHRDAPPPKLDPQDIDKLRKMMADLGNRDPFQVPDAPPNGGPNQMPPKGRPNQFPPNGNPNGVPNQGPVGGPNDPPVPNGLQPQPPLGPPPPRPVEPPNGPPRIDANNPLGLPEEPPEKADKNNAIDTLTALWEKNVGPLDESPAVRRAISDLVSDKDFLEAFTDENGRNLFDALDGNNDNRFGDLFDGGGGWELPKIDFPWGRGRDLDLDFGGRPRNPNFGGGGRDWAPRAPSTSSDWGSLNLAGLKVPLLLLLLVAAVIGCAMLVRKWNAQIRPRSALAGAAGAAPWPIDPRAINSREDVVKAFEYLSVLICGPGAKTWTHSTVADELAALAVTHGETAVKLARLYELARYAPLDEPLTRVELMEARRLVCDLAGIDEA
jgi:hypothetical protein